MANGHHAPYWRILRQGLLPIWFPLAVMVPAVFSFKIGPDVGIRMAVITTGMYLVCAFLIFALQNTGFGIGYRPFVPPRLSYWRMCGFYFKSAYVIPVLLLSTAAYSVSGGSFALQVLGATTLLYLAAMIVVTAYGNAR